MQTWRPKSRIADAHIQRVKNNNYYYKSIKIQDKNFNVKHIHITQGSRYKKSTKKALQIPKRREKT